MPKHKFRKKRFGQQVKDARLNLGLSLRACAEQMGIDHTTLHLIEKGNNFSIDKFANIWKWLENQKGSISLSTINHYIKKLK